MSFHDPIDSAHRVEPTLPSGRPMEQGGRQVSRLVTVVNTLGLHMRPVMRFVDLASQFESRITVSKGGHVVDGKNPMEMMLLDASQGTELEIRADGADAAQAIDALAGLAKGGFGEA